jgi:hypothetical protein
MGAGGEEAEAGGGGGLMLVGGAERYFAPLAPTVSYLTADSARLASAAS